MEFPRVLHKGKMIDGKPEVISDGNGGHKLNRITLHVADKAAYDEAKAKGWKDEPVSWPIEKDVDAPFDEGFDDEPEPVAGEVKRPIPKAKGK